ncbi:MAG: PD-(D/E)XK nuclease family protein, partial [Cyanobacteria bacterium P01_A01_bin.83]
TIKDLLRSGIDLTKLQQHPNSRIQSLGKLGLVYQRNLRQIKRIDSAELYWQGVQSVQYQQAYLFYGYLAPGNDELAVINAIAGQDSVLVLPSTDLYPQNYQARQWLQSQGWEVLADSKEAVPRLNYQLQQCFTEKSLLPSGVRLNVFPDLQAEVRGVLTKVKVLLNQGIATQDIVLVTKDEQLYGDMLRDLAWEHNLPVQVSYEITLEQTRLGAWLKLLLEVIRDDFPFEATARLLSHPLSNCMSLSIWSAARQTHPQGLDAWQRIGVDLSLLDWQDCDRRSAWIDYVLNIMSIWDVLENARSYAQEIMAYYRLNSGLRELSYNSEQKQTKSQFITEIQDILALLTIPAQPGRGGVELHCPSSLHGITYPYVFVLGAAEGILPTAIADDPVLDFHDRKQLAQQGFNLKTAVDLAQQETFEFYCLLNVPTHSIVFSYPELIAHNTVLPSPYLSRLGLKPSPVNNLPVTSVEQARQLYLRQSDLLSTVITDSLLIPEIKHKWEVETSRESASRSYAGRLIAPDQYDGIINFSIDEVNASPVLLGRGTVHEVNASPVLLGRGTVHHQSRIFSASQLTQLGQCPFKWFSARLLKLKELEEAESELSAAARGVLYHRCLELCLSEIKTAADLSKFKPQQLASAFAIAEQELQLTKLPGWNAQRQEHLKLIAMNLSSTEFLPTDHEVIATETKFIMDWHGLQVRGQVDRIDRTPTGLTVIDYKTSGTIPAGVKDDAGKATVDLQLAIYHDAIANQYPTEAIETTAYFSLTQQKNITRPQNNSQELTVFADRVKSHLKQGYYPVAPDVDRKACRYCDYDLVCRQGDRLRRKNKDLV